MSDETVKTVQEEAQEFIKKANVEDILKNNYVDFAHEDVTYRAYRPTFEQKQKAVEARTTKFLNLLRDKNEDGSPKNLLEKEMIKVYMDRGIDVEDFDRKYDTQQKLRDDYSAKLGQALAENKPEEELKVFKKEIEAITIIQNQLMINKSLLLDSTIESKLNVFVYTYLASLVVKKKVGDDYVPAWSSYEAFIQEREVLVNYAVWYTSLVSKNELPTL